MFSPQSDLTQQLEDARRNARALKQSHQATLRAVANSPTKKGKASAGRGGKGTQSAIALSVSTTTIAGPKTRIPAYRPPSGLEEGKEVEGVVCVEAIPVDKVVGAVLTNEALDIDEAAGVAGVAGVAQVAISGDASDSVVDQDVVQATPLFLTKKKNVMHCELDEPGLVAYPKNHMKKGFFERLFGCFRTPSIYSPVRISSHQARPPSSGMVPSMLTLEKEVAPLRASLNAEEGFDSVTEKSTDDQSVLSGALPYVALEGMHHEAVTVDGEGITVTKEDIYSSRLLRQQQHHAQQQRVSVATTRIPDPLPASTNHDHTASHASSPAKSIGASPIRMTKAQRLREQANLQKIEARHVAESKHYQAMPRAVRKSLAAPRCGKSLLPHLRESLHASTFDAAKRASIETAAAKVLAPEDEVSEVSERGYNPLMSMSFSDDPFYRELAKIDHSLTQDDLDKLRDVLASSDFEPHPFK